MMIAFYIFCFCVILAKFLSNIKISDRLQDFYLESISWILITAWKLSIQCVLINFLRKWCVKFQLIQMFVYESTRCFLMTTLNQFLSIWTSIDNRWSYLDKIYFTSSYMDIAKEKLKDYIEFDFSHLFQFFTDPLF